jgi:hypothetical protein
MFYKLIISLLLIISFHSSLFAQEDKKHVIAPDTLKLNLLEKKKDVTAPETPKEKKLEKELQKRLYSLPQFIHETSLFIKQPTKWIGRDWLKCGIITVAAIGVMPFDERITNSTQGEQQYYYNPFIEGGRIYGEWYSIATVAGGFGIYGLLAHDTSAKKISIELLQAGLYSELVTSVLKIIISRARPVYTDNAFTYRPFTVANFDFHSMPSGHTTSAFALSTVMSRHAHSTVLKVLAYVPAGFTMFSRIYQHKHWLSDEIPAAAIGYFVGNWVVDLHEGKRHRINVTSLYPINISYALN